MRINYGRAPGANSLHQTENFTGEVWADPVMIDAVGVTMHHVFFAPRARTYWHTHDAGQILYVTSGSGRVVSRHGGAAKVRAGDVVWIEPGEEHWHGADEGTYLVHTAVSLGGHEWLAPVTDEEYDAH
jgi:quercetin dioxygenase-like cupin family protein